MIRVGTIQFRLLPMEQRISLLVKRGYTRAAFRTKANALSFAEMWRRKGYDPSGSRSTGPVVEGGVWPQAYLVVRGPKVKRRKTRT